MPTENYAHAYFKSMMNCFGFGRSATKRDWLESMKALSRNVLLVVTAVALGLAVAYSVFLRKLDGKAISVDPIRIVVSVKGSDWKYEVRPAEVDHFYETAVQSPFRIDYIFEDCEALSGYVVSTGNHGADTLDRLPAKWSLQTDRGNGFIDVSSTVEKQDWKENDRVSFPIPITECISIARLNINKLTSESGGVRIYDIDFHRKAGLSDLFR